MPHQVLQQPHRTPKPSGLKLFASPAQVATAVGMAKRAGGAEGTSKRKVKREAASQAAAITDGMAGLVDVAFEKQMDFITEKLHNDRALAYQLGSLLRDGTLCQILNAPKVIHKAPPTRRLPPNAKKFKHIRAALCQELLQAIEPKFTADWFAKWEGDGTKSDISFLHLITYGLNVKATSDLPRKWWPQCAKVDEFIKVCRMRYQAMGCRLKDVPSISDAQELSKVGYYELEENKVKCIIFPDVVLELPPSTPDKAEPSIEIQNNGEQAALLWEEAWKRTTDVKVLFEAKAVKFIDEDSAWELEGIEPVAEDTSSASAGSEIGPVTPDPKGSQACRWSPSAELSEALASRLKGTGKVAAAKPP